MNIIAFNLGIRYLRPPKKLLLIMKLTTFILIIALAQVSARGFGQKITLNETNTPIEKVLQTVRSQSGYEFFYNTKDLDGQKITIKLKNATVDEAVQKIIKDLPLTYKIVNNNIVLTKKEPSLLENIIARFQEVDVRGKVADSLGNGLAGATVNIKNAKGSTSTDNNGNFYLKNIDEGSVLVVSYLGYVTKEQVVSKEYTYIQLQQSTSKLDEVQIQAYGLTSRRLSTGNIATIKAEEIEKQPVDNPLLVLMGRVPGLMITPSSGLPGAPVSVQLRGQNSISRTGVGNSVIPSEPLFIIDGVPFVNTLTTNLIGFSQRGAGPAMSALQFINPKDIESIDVLKDGDATAIYGSRGANGVILITTKKGKAGVTRLNFNSVFGFGEIAKKLDLMNTQQYLEMRKEAYFNDGLPVPNFSSAKNSTNYDLTLWDQNRYTDWQEVLAGGKAEQYNFNATISGGSANLNYIFSGNYRSQGTVFLGDSKDKMGSARLSMQGVSPNGKFTTNISASFTGNDSSRPDYSGLSIGLAPNAPALYSGDGSLNWEPAPSGVASWSNPIARILNVAEIKSNLFTGGIEMSYLLLPSLQLKTNAAFTKNQGNNFIPDRIASGDPFNSAILTGTANYTSNKFNSWSFEPQLNYRRKLGRGNVNVIVGGSLQGEQRYADSYFAIGFTNDNLLRSLAAATSISQKNNTTSEYKYTGVFGRVNYNWEEKYLINMTARRDGSSRFGPGEQFGNFWSMGSAWVFSNERFLKANPILSFGKLRFSYGTTGNDAIGDYRFLELYSFGSNPNSDPTYQGGKQLISSGATNPYYHWEETRKMELAIEVGLFNDKIYLGLARFRNRSTDQLGNLDLPSTGGNTFIVANRAAKIQNTGTEISFNSKNIEVKNFRWSTIGNLSLQRNKLLALPDGFYRLGNDLYGPYVDPIGKPFSGFVNVREFRGVDANSGVYQFSNTDGGMTIDAGINQFAKTITFSPKFTGGLRNTFTYKGLGLDVFFDFAKQMGKNYLFDNQFLWPGRFSSTSGGDNGVGNMPVEAMRRWQESNQNSDIQKFSQNFSIAGAFNNVKESDFGWVDASYIKLRNVSLSYNIPQKTLQRWKLQTLSFNIQGQNLLTITKYKGTDPQTQNVGFLAQLRVITAGISIGL